MIKRNFTRNDLSKELYQSIGFSKNLSSKIVDNFFEILVSEIIKSGKEFNLSHFGMLALDSMRLEKNYRSWKSDLTSDFTILQSGLKRWLNLNKENFIGKDALKRELDIGVTKTFVTLIVEDPEDNEPFGEPVYLSPVFSGDNYLGPIVSSGYGHRVKKSISMAILDNKILKGLNDQIYIEVLGRKRKASIVKQALYDPENNKLRS